MTEAQALGGLFVAGGVAFFLLAWGLWRSAGEVRHLIGEARLVGGAIGLASCAMGSFLIVGGLMCLKP